MANSSISVFPFIKVFGHHVITVGGLAGRKPQDAVHNYLIVLVVVHNDPKNVVIWNGKEAGKDCGTVSFSVGALPVCQRINPEKHIIPPLHFQTSAEVIFILSLLKYNVSSRCTLFLF